MAAPGQVGRGRTGLQCRNGHRENHEVVEAISSE